MTGSRPNLSLLITPCDKTAHGKVPMAHVLRAAVQSSRCQGALQPRVQGAASAVVLHCGSHSCVPNLKAEIFGCLIAEGGDGPAVAGSRGHPQPPVCRDAPFAAVIDSSQPFPAPRSLSCRIVVSGEQLSQAVVPHSATIFDFQTAFQMSEEQVGTAQPLG